MPKHRSCEQTVLGARLRSAGSRDSRKPALRRPRLAHAAVLASAVAGASEDKRWIGVG